VAEERPVVNASPLIFLAQGDMLDFLQLAGAEVVVPMPVASEIQRRGSSDLTARAIANTSWLVIVEALPIPPLIQTWDLGEGESSVLAWAYAHSDTEAIVDDLAARRCAASLDIPVRGTLGLVLTAKRRGIIPAARPVVDRLRQAGMYLSDHVMRQALALVSE
jgi:predicted nucleic acid-binding protein